MKADRLLSILLLMQARGRVTGRELAERLEVSERTIHRDLEALSAAHIPVIALRGPQGGWELEKGWRTQVPGLDEGELRALLMAQPRVLGHSPLAASAQSALDKLMAALPGTVRAQATAMRERLLVDPAGWWQTGEDLSMLNTVQDAVARERQLSFEYVRADGVKSARTADPLGLVAKGVTWYLVARTPKGMRTFRVSRISEAVVLGSGFERPARFDLASYWAQTKAEMEGRQTAIEVVLGLAPEAVQTMAMHHLTTSTAGEVAASRLPRGWELRRVHFDDEKLARFVVLGLGARAVVIAPAPFRRQIAVEVRKMASRKSRGANSGAGRHYHPRV
jgi:predicted DNA-binding transcriptional regulator YafY